MVFMMLIVVLVLITKVLPIFEQVFAQLGTSMSGFAQSLLSLGNALNRYSIILVAVLVILAACFLYFSSPAGRGNFKKLMRKFALTRKLMHDIELERFASGMVLTLSSGMDTYEGLGLVKKLSSDDDMKEKTNIFTSFYAQMISVGFKSGSMDQAMRQVSERLEKDTERRIYSLISILEPTLVIILSLIVGMILLSVILPLMGIMTTIG